MTGDSIKQVLDLRTTKCPLNFVQTKLALEKLAVGDKIQVMILSDAESAINIPNSIKQEGHTVLAIDTADDGIQTITIEKAPKGV